MGYRVVKKHDNMFSRFDRVPACDGQTDRRTDGQTISITCFSIADARKNAIIEYLRCHSWVCIAPHNEIARIVNVVESDNNTIINSLLCQHLDIDAHKTKTIHG